MQDEDSVSVMSPRASCNRADYWIPIRPRAQLALNKRSTGKEPASPLHCTFNDNTMIWSLKRILFIL